MTSTDPDPRVLLELGLAVFPLPVGGTTARRRWQRTIVADAEELAAWPVGANVGVPCRVNSLVVLDLDRKGGVDGAAVLAAAASAAGQTLPDTLVVDTPSGGRHLYWWLPAGRVIFSSSGGTSELGPGIDVRAPGAAWGGYVAGPGSVVDGRAYTVAGDAPIAELPAWIADILENRQAMTPQTMINTDIRVDGGPEHSSQSLLVTNAPVRVCKNPACGNKLPAPVKRGGRAAEFCSQRCRMATHRAKHQPTLADLRYDALGQLRRLKLPTFTDEVLEHADAEQLADLLSFLRTAVAGLSGVSTVLTAVTGGTPAPNVTEPAVTQPAPAEQPTALDPAAAAAIADCFWCDENGQRQNDDGDLVTCEHDDPAEQPRTTEPAAEPVPASEATADADSSYWDEITEVEGPDGRLVPSVYEDPRPSAAELAYATPRPTPATRRALIGGLSPTDEQHAIIEACLTGDDLVVEAGAGTGKTSTLKMAASSMRGRGLYIAFNKAIADEAGRSFPRSVDCRTAHSLAYRAVGKAYADAKGLNGPRVPSGRIAEILRILEPLRVNTDTLLTPAKQARLAVEAVSAFCYSADLEIDTHHIHVPEGLTPTENGMLREVILPYARKAWDDLRDPNSGSLRFEHDHYLKIWAMGDPRLDVDYVLLDEAQDSNPLIAHLVQSQREAQRIAVGDACQAIYGWRGAVDAMETWPGRTRLLLSQSWRFGPEIAGEANKWLDHLKSRLRLVGSGPAGTVTTMAPKTDAVLCRTNSEALSQAMYAMESGRKAALVGGGKQIKALAEAAISLQEGKGTDHPELIMFDTWDELRTYATTEQAGSDLIALVRLIDNHGAEEVKKAAGALVAENRADIVISTVHKAKGREWNSVKIATDFPEPRVHPETNRYLPLPRPDMMLAYVAVTRAKTLLDRRGLTGVDRIGTQAPPPGEAGERYASSW